MDQPGTFSVAHRALRGVERVEDAERQGRRGVLAGGARGVGIRDVFRRHEPERGPPRRHRHSMHQGRREVLRAVDRDDARVLASVLRAGRGLARGSDAEADYEFRGRHVEIIRGGHRRRGRLHVSRSGGIQRRGGVDVHGARRGVPGVDVGAHVERDHRDVQSHVFHRQRQVAGRVDDAVGVEGAPRGGAADTRGAVQAQARDGGGRRWIAARAKL